MPLTAARGAGDAGAPRPGRQGGRCLERPGDQRSGRGGHLARCTRSRRRRGAVRRVPGRRTPRGTGGCSASPATGVAGTHAGVLEDYGCVATGFLALACATGDGVWLERAGALLETVLDALRGRRRRLPRHRRRRRGADGAAARPLGQRQPERALRGRPRAALVRRPHRIGPAPRGRRARAARLAPDRRRLAPLRRLVPRRGRDRPRRPGRGRRRRPGRGRSATRSSAPPGTTPRSARWSWPPSRARAPSR